YSTGLTVPRPHTSSLFPYTTLFRSERNPTGTVSRARSAPHPTAVPPHRRRSAAPPPAADLRWCCPRPDQLRGIVLAPVPLLGARSEEHTSELQSREQRVCRRLLDQR